MDLQTQTASLAACPDVIHPAMVVDVGTDLWFLLLSSEVAVCVSNEVVLWGLLANVPSGHRPYTKGRVITEDKYKDTHRE